MFTLDVCVYVNVKFNIMSMETQTQMHRMGLNSFLMFSVDNVKLDGDVDANTNVKCERTQLESIGPL